jgi:predicted RNase H-like HicB family nuclease
MPIHEEVLGTARRLCRQRGGWTFSPEEVVRALPHLNESSVRTHIVSRCCVNAPKNHPHKWDYFRRVGRGLYEIRAGWREERRPSRQRGDERRRSREGSGPSIVAETSPQYRGRPPRALRDTIHAVLLRDGNVYVAECLEVAVVTQGRTLDEVIENLRAAITLHLEGEDPAEFGLTPSPRLVVSLEVPDALDAVQA